MPIPTAILFTLALFAAVMVALGWSMDATAPTLGDWFVAKITEGGLWAGMFLFLLVVAYFTWRGGRADKESTGPKSR